MEGFRYYQVRLRGLAPGLLLSNGQMSDPGGWYVARLDELRGKEAAGEEVERQRLRYQVTGRLYLDDQKRIVLPAEMLSSAFRKGAAAVSRVNGRKWWAGLTVTADAPLEVPGGLPPWDRLWEDARFVLRNMARAANGLPQPRYRPWFRAWEAVVPVEIDPGVLDAGVLERVVAATGRAVGIGDWRPSAPKNPGKHGRFVVLGIEEVADPDRPAAAAAAAAAAQQQVLRLG